MRKLFVKFLRPPPLAGKTVNDGEIPPPPKKNMDILRSLLKNTIRDDH